MTGPLLLRQKLAAARTRALAEGALEPIVTEEWVTTDRGISFVIRVVSSLAHKEADKEQAARRKGKRGGDDPFLPYDPALFVADISPTHVGLLNKYPVVDDHLLVVTRRFVDQRELLDETDFDALARSLAEVDGLAFYNAGAIAGASQRHRHLQVVPLPLSTQDPRTCAAVPLEPALELDQLGEGAGRSARLPFAHALARLPAFGSVADLARGLEATYTALREHLGLSGEAPYNLLVTRRFMLLVPRKREHAAGVSINALGFAGALFARNREELDALVDLGPFTALAEVAG